VPNQMQPFDKASQSSLVLECFGFAMGFPETLLESRNLAFSLS